MDSEFWEVGSWICGRVCLDLGFAEQFVVGGSVYLDPRFKHILGLHI